MKNRTILVRGFLGLLFVLMLVGCGVPNLGSIPLNMGSNSSAASSIQTDGRTRGNPNAPVTLVEFSDFQ